MICSKCGAKLRERDKFCPECGSAIRKVRPAKQREDDVPDYFEHGVLYDETLFRDGILEEQQEKRSHALLVTLTVLLALAVLVFVFLIGFFILRKNADINEGNQNQQYVDGTSGNQGDIVIIDGGAADSGDAQGTGEKPGGEEKPQGGENTGDTAAQADTEAHTEPQTQAATEKETQPARESRVKALDTARIEEIMSMSEAGKYGIFVYDLINDGELILSAGEEKMYASAVISVPILYTAAVLLDEGKISMDDQITYVNSIGGRGEANPEQRHGIDFPLSYYLKTMVLYSDNNCINCLIDFLTLDVINSTCHAAGYNGIDLQRKIVAEVTDGSENYVSAHDIGMMLAEMFKNKFKAVGRDFLMENMQADLGDYGRTSLGLSSELPADLVFLNQNGRGDTRYTEAALFIGENTAYAVGLTLSGPYGFSFDDQTAQVSGLIWNTMNAAE